MKLKICFFMVFFTSFLIYPLSYDFAIRTAQKGDIAAADEKIRKIVVNAPDNADVLYDAGVIAHELNNYHQSMAYFARAAHCADADKNMCFRSYFNAGNSAVAQKDLNVALEYYDKALAIESDNQYARHNRDKVAQMLQDQEKQQDQEKNDTQDPNKKEDQDNKDKQDNKNDQQGQSEQKDQNQQQKNDGNQNEQQNQDDDASENKSDEKPQGDQGKSSNQKRKREQGKKQGNHQQSDQSEANDKKGDGEQKFDEKSKNEQNKREQQERKQHEKSPENHHKDKTNNSIPPVDKQEQGKAAAEKALKDQSGDSGGMNSQESEMEKAGQKIEDPWLVQILDEQELQDKAVNKKLMEARIRQHGGKNDQNCW